MSVVIAVVIKCSRETALVENLACSAGDLGLILGQGTETPHATGKLLDNKEHMCYNEDPLQRGKKKRKEMRLREKSVMSEVKH